MKNHKREFNSNQSAEESNISSSIGANVRRSQKKIKQQKVDDNTVDFYSSFENYRGKSYEELILSEASSEYVPIPKRISNKEQQTPFKLVKVIRYLSAGAAFVLVFTALIAMQPFKLTRAHLSEEAKTKQESNVRPAVLRLSDNDSIKLLDRSGKVSVETVANEEAKKVNVISDSAEVYAPVAAELNVPAQTVTSAVTPEVNTANMAESTTAVPVVQPQQNTNTADTKVASGINSSVNNESTQSNENLNIEEINRPVNADRVANVTEQPEVPATEAKSELVTDTASTQSTSQKVEMTESPTTTTEPKTEVPTTTQPLDYKINGDVIDLDQSSSSSNSKGYKHSEKEMNMLYHLVAAEAGHDWDYNGQLRIARVVANRLNSGRYGNTLEDVITYPKQFTPVEDGTYMSRQPSEIQIKAAQDAMNGAGSDIFDDKVIGFCTKECYETNPYFRDETQLKVVEEYNGVVFFKFAWDD